MNYLDLVTVEAMIVILTRFVIVHILSEKKYGRHENLFEDFYATVLSIVAIIILYLCINMMLGY